MKKSEVCEIHDCPRNEIGVCELSKVDKDVYEHREPKNCSHRLFILRERE